MLHSAMSVILSSGTHMLLENGKGGASAQSAVLGCSCWCCWPLVNRGSLEALLRKLSVCEAWLSALEKSVKLFSCPATPAKIHSASGETVVLNSCRTQHLH